MKTQSCEDDRASDTRTGQAPQSRGAGSKGLYQGGRSKWPEIKKSHQKAGSFLNMQTPHPTLVRESCVKVPAR